MRFLAAVFVLLSLVASPAAADESDADFEARTQAASDLLETMGGTEMFDSVFSSLIEQVLASEQALNPELSPEVFEVYQTELSRAFSEYGQTFVDMTTKIYARHFSVDEILAINEFYRTPAGAALLKKMPLVAAESMQQGTLVGQAVATKSVERAQQKLKERGLSLN